MFKQGTLVICVQNLDFSGANQVILNLIVGKLCRSNVVVLSPKCGNFSSRLVDSGVAVRVGDVSSLLQDIRDVVCVICNTIMTADIVLELVDSPIPVLWILHEWWDDSMIIESLRIRNYKNLTLQTIKMALAKATRVICVCDSQRKFYNPSAATSVIYVGVPDPLLSITNTSSTAAAAPPKNNSATNLASLISPSNSLPLNGISSISKTRKTFIFLCLGIICPRKNQLWAVQMFKEFARTKPVGSCKMLVVGARYIRPYEIEYLNRVKAEIGNHPDIEIRDVTDDVDDLYRQSDCMMLTSLNEVTPMVISEALSWSLPVISTNIAGIKEMFDNGIEGFHFDPDDSRSCLKAMNLLYSDERLHLTMAKAARKRFESVFNLPIMINHFKRVIYEVAPPTILVDMDGVLVDWDRGFRDVWGKRSSIDRSKSYYMEDCVDSKYRNEAISLVASKGFFERLPPMNGAVDAMREMISLGLKVMICTSPIIGSQYCAQEKLNWVRAHLGEEWVSRVIICFDKTYVTGDILIDDKPMHQLDPRGAHKAATWKQFLFDAPYNRGVTALPRILSWKDWKQHVFPSWLRPMVEASMSTAPVNFNSKDAIKKDSAAKKDSTDVKKQTNVYKALTIGSDTQRG